MTAVILGCSVGCGLCSLAHLVLLGVWVFRIVAEGDWGALVFVALLLILVAATGALSWLCFELFQIEKEIKNDH